jgi:hypothetical protein
MLIRYLEERHASHHTFKKIFRLQFWDIKFCALPLGDQQIKHEPVSRLCAREHASPKADLTSTTISETITAQQPNKTT